MCFCVDLQRHVRKKCMPVGVRVREGNSNPLQYSCLGNAERLHFHFSLSRIGEGQGNPLQCSCLENPRDRGAWWAAVYGVGQGRTRLKRLSSTSSSRGPFLWVCLHNSALCCPCSPNSSVPFTVEKFFLLFNQG